MGFALRREYNRLHTACQVFALMNRHQAVLNKANSMNKEASLSHWIPHQSDYYRGKTDL